MKINNAMNANKGFTLIELIVVIIILGILAATAAPKFIDLKSSAQTATLEAIKASMEGASALVHSKSIVAGNHNVRRTFGNEPTVTLGDGDLVITYGYPLGRDTDWIRLIDFDANVYGTKLTTDGRTTMFYFLENSAPDNISEDCLVYYTQVDAVNGTPTITVKPCV